MICAGIDGGSRAIKILLMDAGSGEVVAKGVRDQGVDHDRLARELFEDLLKSAGIDRRDVARIIATGYTRNGITLADTTVTEITCHAVGVRHVARGARTVIEVGGQDAKLLRLTAEGAVRDFAMNDRCAAGTGRFLEMVAGRLDTNLDGLGDLAARAEAPAPVSSMCVVFAETEIIGLLASGERPADIVAGVQRAIASRVAGMLGREVVAPVVFTGGVAMVSGMAAAVAEAVGAEVQVVHEPQMSGALGAAILACREARAV
jgi:predicted CoA-substrate-specific enzyme activase